MDEKGGSGERVARGWAIVTGQEVSEGPGWVLANLAYLRDHWELLSDRRDVLGLPRELALKARITPVILHRHMLNPLIREELLPMLPKPVYEGLRTLWLMRPGR